MSPSELPATWDEYLAAIDAAVHDARLKLIEAGMLPYDWERDGL